MSDTPLIRAQDITKIYKMGDSEYHALKGVSFEVQQGEFIAIVGESGSGKSTIMHIIGLLSTPSSGKVWLNGKDVSSLTPDEAASLRNQYIGFIFQSFFLLPKLDAMANVGLPLQYRGMSKHDIMEKSEAALARVGMSDYSHHKPTELSGGQQQRVAIARAIVGQPRLLFGDEPTGALDSHTSSDVMALLKELNQKDHTTIIMVTHDRALAEQCPRQIEVKDGLLAANS